MSLELNLRFPDPAHVMVSLDGERDEDMLHAQLNDAESLILDTILRGLADP